MNIHTYATPVTIKPARTHYCVSWSSPGPLLPSPQFASSAEAGPFCALQARRMVVALYQDTLTYENMMQNKRGVLQVRLSGWAIVFLQWDPEST